MTIEDIGTLTIMSHGSNAFLPDETNRFSRHEADEGFCINLSSKECTTEIRRVRSTPNLLQIPSPFRNRKKSGDSAVVIGDDSESEKSCENVTPPDERARDFILHRQRSDETPGDRQAKLQQNLKLLRPPSVVVSDHDLGNTKDYVTLDDLDAEFVQRSRRRPSDCSSCSSLSLADSWAAGDESDCDVDLSSSTKQSKWRTVRTIIHHTTPFMQIYMQQKYLWVQLAGHQGNFKAGGAPGTILKKYCAREEQACEKLKNDALAPFVPAYHGVFTDNEGNQYLQMEDLLSQFSCPCVMDCKIGVRTYLEEELKKAKEKPKLRKDMYEKMLQIDPSAPTEEEHQLRGVTKPRYMVWRETISTTASMGFRIEGIRKSSGSCSKDFKTTKTEDAVKKAFSSFFGSSNESIIKMYLERLNRLKEALTESTFFATHEVIGSSLLFVHDKDKASVWMIDFAKTCPLPEECVPISHSKPWSLGNHEDGYFIGLSNLIRIFESLCYPPLGDPGQDEANNN